METGHPSTRTVNSGSGNRALERVLIELLNVGTAAANDDDDDINEYTQGVHRCDGHDITDVNSPGSYEYRCPDGCQLAGDLRSCQGALCLCHSVIGELRGELVA